MFTLGPFYTSHRIFILHIVKKAKEDPIKNNEIFFLTFIEEHPAIKKKWSKYNEFKWRIISEESDTNSNSLKGHTRSSPKFERNREAIKNLTKLIQNLRYMFFSYFKFFKVSLLTCLYIFISNYWRILIFLINLLKYCYHEINISYYSMLI